MQSNYDFPESISHAPKLPKNNKISKIQCGSNLNDFQFRYVKALPILRTTSIGKLLMAINVLTCKSTKKLEAQKLNSNTHDICC